MLRGIGKIWNMSVKHEAMDANILGLDLEMMAPELILTAKCLLDLQNVYYSTVLWGQLDCPQRRPAF